MPNIMLLFAIALLLPSLASAAGGNFGGGGLPRCNATQRARQDPKCYDPSRPTGGAASGGGAAGPGSSVGGAAPAGGLHNLPGTIQQGGLLANGLPPGAPSPTGSATAFQGGNAAAPSSLGGAAEAAKGLSALSGSLAGPTNADGTCPANTEPRDKPNGSGQKECVPKAMGK